MNGPAQSDSDAEEKEAIRVELLQWWIRSGGEPEKFEKAFPKLYEAELEKRLREKLQRMFRDH